MVAFRWLVAALVAVVTLFGGAFRAPVVDDLRAQIVLERVSDDAEQGTLERGRSIVQARATGPSRAPANDGLSMGSSVEPSSRAFARCCASSGSLDAPAVIDVVPRRVRPHVEHMVFLI